jgi:dihydrofolate synthase/folylpolyglutamate synthase
VKSGKVLAGDFVPPWDESPHALEQGRNYLLAAPKWLGGSVSFGLESMRLLMKTLGDPQDTFKSIHIAGTNGKGSTSVILAAILAQQGERIGLTTSPSLSSDSERIVVDGLPVTENLLHGAAYCIKKATDGLGISLSHFELITSCAFLIFAAMRVDYAVVEVGLGGRLDATNVLSRPEITIITSIGYDHVDILGGDIRSIATEKSGIIKQSVPLLTGEHDNEACKAIEVVAHARSAPMSVYSKDFSVCFAVNKSGESELIYSDNVTKDTLKTASFGLKGAYQDKNYALAIKAALMLGVSFEHIYKGLESVRWPGRFEIVTKGNVQIIIDGAHNEQGISALTSSLDNLKIGSVHLVFGASADKEWKRFISKLDSYVVRYYLVAAQGGRFADTNAIEAYIQEVSIKPVVNWGNNCDEGIKAAILVAEREATLSGVHQSVLVTGSLYLLGTIRSALSLPFGPLWRVAR